MKLLFSYDKNYINLLIFIATRRFVSLISKCKVIDLENCNCPQRFPLSIDFLSDPVTWFPPVASTDYGIYPSRGKGTLGEVTGGRHPFSSVQFQKGLLGDSEGSVPGRTTLSRKQRERGVLPTISMGIMPLLSAGHPQSQG